MIIRNQGAAAEGCMEHLQIISLFYCSRKDQNMLGLVRYGVMSELQSSVEAVIGLADWQ